MNKTIELLLNHRSIRKFKNKKIEKEKIHKIVNAAQQASTSSHVMAYTIIGITDESIKSKLANISGQHYVKDNGHLFVFCADLHRIYNLSTIDNEEHIKNNIESVEQFIVSTIDTSLAAQNAIIAAESMGLGCCFLGSLRNDIEGVNDLLKLPNYVIPLFGIAMGYPNEQSEIKPRLPLEVVYHENEYLTYSKQKELIQGFNTKIKSYYITRETNSRKDTWTNLMIQKYKTPTRMEVTKFVKDKKLNIR